MRKRQQEQIDQLLAEYPVERSRHGTTQSVSNWGLVGGPSGASDGGFWFGFGGDSGGGGGGGF